VFSGKLETTEYVCPICHVTRAEFPGECCRENCPSPWHASQSTLTFGQWCSRLRDIAEVEPHRYGPDPIRTCGAESWRDYYDDGYSPIQAWREDGAYG